MNQNDSDFIGTVDNKCFKSDKFEKSMICYFLGIFRNFKEFSVI